MKLTPVILLALVPLLILTVAEAAKGKENAKPQSKSASASASASAAAAANGKSAKQSAAKSAGNTAKTASDASKAVPVERHFKFEKESKTKKNSRKMKTKQSAQANMASNEEKSSAKSSSSNEAKKMFIISKEEQKHLTAPLLSHKDSKKSANQVNLQELAYNAKASSHQHQEAAKSKASSSHHHEISPAKQQEPAKIADAKHGGSKSAPCPNCQTGPFHHQLAVSKSSSAESSSSSADKNPAAKNPSHHHHQKSSSSSSTSSAAAVAAADKSAKEAVKKRNHYQHYLHPNTEYGQQPAYLTNAVYHQQPVLSKPAALYSSRPHSSYQHHHNPKPVSYSNSHLYNHHQTNQYGHNDYQQDTLIQANVISRLGDRTPFWLPRNDYYKEKDFPEGLNQLINVGKERLVNYGRVLRERYHNLINNLRLKDITTQSAADRVTVDSALALLAGLLPPTGDQVWSTSNYNADELSRLWQPVAVSTVEAQRDWKLSTEAPCRTAELVENVTITESVPELRHFLTANREVIRRLEVLTGEDFTGDLSWIWIANLYDTYISEAEYFGPAFYPPRWADEQTLAVLKQANELKFSVWGHDQAYLRLRGGPLLQEITDNLIRAAKDEAGGRSLAIYSTFDTNIAIIEHSLGIFRGGQAGYGSGLLIELHRDNNSHYNNHRGNEPVVAVFSVDVPSGVKISQVDLSRSERFRKHCYSTGPSCPLSSFAVALQHHLLSLAEAEVKCNND